MAPQWRRVKALWRAAVATRAPRAYALVMAPRARRSQSRPVDADRLTIRGLDADDLAALNAYVEKRRADIEDGTISVNAAARSLLRSALRAAGAYRLAGVAEP